MGPSQYTNFLEPHFAWCISNMVPPKIHFQVFLYVITNILITALFDNKKCTNHQCVKGLQNTTFWGKNQYRQMYLDWKDSFHLHPYSVPILSNSICSLLHDYENNALNVTARTDRESYLYKLCSTLVYTTVLATLCMHSWDFKLSRVYQWIYSMD